MPVFAYKAKDKNKITKGIIDAVSEDAVANLLYEKGLVVIDIEKKDTSAIKQLYSNFFSGVRSKDLVIYFRQLSVMIEANLPIVRALKIIVRQTESPALKTIISAVSAEVEGGNRLSQAMANFPEVFSEFYINIIKSGETSGRLAEVMNYLADQEEKDYELESKVKGAMIYPAIIVSGLIIVGIIIMIYVMPQMTGMLKEAGVTLPLVTRIFIAISDFMAKFSVLVIGGLIALVIGTSYYLRTKKGKEITSFIKINVPIFGSIFKAIYIVRLCRSFATLLKGGVPVSKALRVVKDVVDNNIFSEMVVDAIKEVDEGNSLAESFVNNPNLPIMVSQMMSIGEETGKLEEILTRVADFYGREVDNKISNLSSLIEPIMMIILGIAVAFFVAAIILPIWQLSSAI